MRKARTDTGEEHEALAHCRTHKEKSSQTAEKYPQKKSTMPSLSEHMPIERGEIRMMKVHPGAFTEPIIGSLGHGLLSSAPEFHALS